MEETTSAAASGLQEEREEDTARITTTTTTTAKSKKVLSASEARKLKAQQRRKKVLKAGRDRLAYITGQAPKPPPSGSNREEEAAEGGHVEGGAEDCNGEEIAQRDVFERNEEEGDGSVNANAVNAPSSSSKPAHEQLVKPSTLTTGLRERKPKPKPPAVTQASRRPPTVSPIDQRTSASKAAFSFGPFIRYLLLFLVALGYHSVMFVCSKTQVNSEREDILPTLFGDFAVPPVVRHLCASDYATPVVSLAIVWFITFEVLCLSIVGLDKPKPNAGGAGLAQLAFQGIATKLKLHIFIQVYEDLVFFLLFLLCLQYFLVLRL